MKHGSVLGAALLTLALPAAAAAQQLSLMGGRAEYDLSGVHTSNVWAVRAAGAAASFLLVEGSVSYIHTEQDFGRTELWLPEVQVQAQKIWGAFAPYLGAGVGMAIDDPDDDVIDEVVLETEVDLTTSVAVGVRIGLLDWLGLRAEGRLQGIEIDYTGTVAGVTAGLVVAF
jgi:hypothetical protein